MSEKYKPSPRYYQGEDLRRTPREGAYTAYDLPSGSGVTPPPVTDTIGDEIRASYDREAARCTA